MDVKVGSKVHVEFDGTVNYDNEDGSFDVEIAGTDKTIEYIPSRFLETNDWPPQVGDIWEVNGDEYFVRKARRGYDGVYIASCNTSTDYLNEMIDQFKALNPSLVRRRGQ